MSRTIIIICIVVSLCLLGVTGCAEDEPQAKTAAEYKAEAEKEIQQENASAELDKLEKSIEEEAAKQQ